MKSDQLIFNNGESIVFRFGQPHLNRGLNVTSDNIFYFYKTCRRTFCEENYNRRDDVSEQDSYLTTHLRLDIHLLH